MCESQFLLAAIKSAYILCWGWVSVCGIDCDGEKPSKAELLGKESSVMQVEKSYRVQKATVHRSILDCPKAYGPRKVDFFVQVRTL